MNDSRASFPNGDPFALDTDSAYQAWRTDKLQQTSELLEKSDPVEIGDLAAITTDEQDELFRRCEISNAVFYRDMQKTAVPAEASKKMRLFAEKLGLRIAEKHRSAGKDGIVSLQVSDSPGQKGYIPYSTKPMNWHTDGYYNAPDEKIRAMVLHCVRAARDGGVNQVFDPEIAYIRLRDENPDFIRALMAPDAMTIPEFVEEDGRKRPESTGPVFWVDEDTGALGMRYTERSRNIAWNDDPVTAQAVAFLRQLLRGDDEPFLFRHRMEPGQGLICNNVLHTRTAFTDWDEPGRGRLMYRSRYSNRIMNTGLKQAA